MCGECRISVHKQCIAYTGRCMPAASAPPPPPPPPPPLPFERELSDKLWYVGELGRDAATHKLKVRENGTYMLRVRPAANVASAQTLPRLKNETNYALSIK